MNNNKTKPLCIYPLPNFFRPVRHCNYSFKLVFLMFLRCHRLPFLHTSEINVFFASSTVRWDVDEYLYLIKYCSFAFYIANRIIETHPQHSRLPCLGVFYLSETQHLLVYVSGPIRDTIARWCPHQEIMVCPMFAHLLRAQRKIIATSVCAKTRASLLS
jgi:hypothetical protein